ncbi:MAG: hypothetical protein K6A44_00345 [bacterium]|nr:hypothetical protein [bacterium]
MELEALKYSDNMDIVPIFRDEGLQFHGAYKTDHYWTGDNKNQFIRSFETSPIDFGLFSTSVAIGKDGCLDTTPRHEKDIFDLYLKVPISESFSFKGRMRTCHGHGSLGGQLRGGLEYSTKLTDKDSFYAQVYVAERMCRKGKSAEMAGFFTGISHKINKNSSFYIEGQVYDLDDLSKGNYGFNLGYKYSF